MHIQYISSIDKSYTSSFDSSEKKAQTSDSKTEIRASSAVELDMDSGSKQKSPIFFNITAHSAKGGLSTTLDSSGVLFPREVEPNFTLEQTKSSLVKESVHLGSKIVEDAAFAALCTIYSDDNRAKTIASQLAQDCIANSSSKNLFSYAFERLEQLVKDSGANQKQIQLAVENFENILSSEYVIVGLLIILG
jgi:hypothetical protein